MALEHALDSVADLNQPTHWQTSAEYHQKTPIFENSLKNILKKLFNDFFMKLSWQCRLNFFCYKNTIITSLKSQKFTWQPAPVCISFTKSKNILTTYIQLYRLNNFFFHISYPRISWSYSVLFKNLNDMFMIFPVLSMIFQDFSRFI